MPAAQINSIDWTTLRCRSGEASFVAVELKLLFDNPNDEDRFDNLWPYLCSEGTTHSAAYASAPFLLELARLATGHARFKYLYVLSLFRMCEPTAPSQRACSPAYRESYQLALREALPLVAELSTQDFGYENFYVLSALAALKEMPRLASCIESISLEEFKCPECQEPLA